MNLFIMLLVSLVFYSESVFAHQKHQHKTSPEPTDKIESLPFVAVINAQYISEVKKLFLEKCGDCHGSNTVYPWYYRIPVVTQIIDRDIRNAKKHLDITKDYPFGGHGTPKEDLLAIREVLTKGSMPPLRYRILHQGAIITEEEKIRILKWVEMSLQHYPR